MVQFFRINVGYRARERSLLNTILAIATGILTIIYPNLLYLIVAGYLLLLGIMMVYFKMPPLLAAFPVVAGILIFLLPELIPYTFAAFLGFFGFILLLWFQFGSACGLTLFIALLTLLVPVSIAFIFGLFLLVCGVSELIRYIQDRERRERLVY